MFYLAQFMSNLKNNNRLLAVQTGVISLFDR